MERVPVCGRRKERETRRLPLFLSKILHVNLTLASHLRPVGLIPNVFTYCVLLATIRLDLTMKSPFIFQEFALDSTEMLLTLGLSFKVSLPTRMIFMLFGTQ